MVRSYSVYKNRRIYIPDARDFEIDSLGRFKVFSMFEEPDSRAIRRVSIPDCTAPDYNQAIRLSIDYAMRIIDGALVIE